MNVLLNRLKTRDFLAGRLGSRDDRKDISKKWKRTDAFPSNNTGVRQRSVISECYYFEGETTRTSHPFLGIDAPQKLRKSRRGYSRSEIDCKFTDFFSRVNGAPFLETRPQREKSWGR